LALIAIGIHVISDKEQSPFQETKTADGQVKQYIPDCGVRFQNYFLQ
jgi:hypothetical protein